MKLITPSHSESTAHSNDINISHHEKIPKIGENPLIIDLAFRQNFTVFAMCSKHKTIHITRFTILSWTEWYKQLCRSMYGCWDICVQFKYKYFKSHVTEVLDSAHITYVHMPLYKRVCVFHISHAVWVPTGSAGAWDRELVVESGEGRANRRCCECHPSPLNLYRCQSVVLTYPSLSSCLSIRSCVGLEAADECCRNSACHSTERIRTLAHSFYPRPSILHT